jgi:hypothetical protein
MRRALIVMIPIVALGLYGPASAHPGPEKHAHIMRTPIAGVTNNYWKDYKSDVSEAERELRSDLRRADTKQDRREAWAEYRQEIADANKDYAQEMAERGYRRGTVIVE